MNSALFSLNLLCYVLIYNSNYVYTEDILLGTDFISADSEQQNSENKSSESFELNKNPNLNSSVLEYKTSYDINFDDSKSSQFRDELRFFTFVPKDNKKVIELTTDQYTFTVDENNHEVFHYEFPDNYSCAKIKYDDSTIWRSGDYFIDRAKYVIYNKNNDRIVVRDDERSITYRLVDDAPEQDESLEPSGSESERTESSKLGPFDSAITYVAYVSDTFKGFKKSRSSVVLILFFLFGLLLLISLMLVGLLLLVIRLHKVVDQIKLNIGNTETKVVI